MSSSNAAVRRRWTSCAPGGRTVVLVSHGLAQVRQLCDQAAWLDHGSMKMCGPTEGVVDAYLSSVTTAYRLDDQGRQRTGTGDVQLEVELLTADDDSRHIATGEPLTIRFHWKATQKIDDVVFVFTVRAADGYEVGGAATFHDREEISVGPGSGYVDFSIPRFPILPGSYHARQLRSTTAAAATSTTTARTLQASTSSPATTARKAE